MSAAEHSVLPDWMYEAVNHGEELSDPEVRHVYEHKYIRVSFIARQCLNCRELVEHRHLRDHYREVQQYECSNCHTRIQLDMEGTR